MLIAPEGRFEGRDQVESYYRVQFEAFASISLDVRATFDTTDTAVAEWSFSGTNSGALPLPDGEIIPATGERITQRGVDIAKIEDGRISEHRLYYDQAELLEQLGMLSVSRSRVGQCRVIPVVSPGQDRSWRAYA